MSTDRAIERPAAPTDPGIALERRRAALALLDQPLLHADGPTAESFRLVRRHRGELAKLFAEGLGYRLVVDPESARLIKPGLGHDATRPLLKNSGLPFPPRAYAMLCLVLAALTTARQQLLVDELVAAVRSVAVAAGLDLDLDRIADRRDLYAAITVLLRLGVLVERDGDLERWAGDGTTQSLLDVRRDRLSLLRPRALVDARSPESLLETASLPSAAGGARVAVRRTLVESPVLSTADLPQDQALWWRRNRNREREWFRERLGLELELRAEGACATDPDDAHSDVSFPSGGSHKHFALLLLGELVDRLRHRALAAADRTWVSVSESELAAAAGAVFDQWSAGLRRDHREQPELVREQALAVLVQMGLVRTAGPDGVRVHAAAARYSPTAELHAALQRPAAHGSASLFATDPEESP